MRKSSFALKRVISIVMVIVMLAGTLSGCEYESFDDYLVDLGLKDPEISDDGVSESVSGSEASVEDPVKDIQVDHEWESEPKDTEDDPSEGALMSSALNSAASLAGSTVEGTSDAAIEDATSLAEGDSAASTASSLEGEGAAISPSEASSLGSTIPGAENSDYTAPATSHALSEDEMIGDRESLGITDEGIAARKKEQEGLYAYERLTDAGKTLYVEMLIIMENMASNIMVSTTSEDALELVFDYVMTDHPEIFYVSGYHFTNYTVDGEITAITFTGKYDYSPAEVSERQSRIDSAVAACLANAPSSSDEYFIIKYVYEYLINNTEYDQNAQDNQNICSVFLTGKSVCNGYAKAAQYLLSKLGVKSTLVIGLVNTKNSKNVRHAWNLVECNGAYYYMDVTWGDASYQTMSGETADSSRYPDVNYDYLNVTSQEIFRTHSAFDTLAMPVCTSMQDNYYVREDEYFSSPEMTLVGELFDRRYKDGSDNVTIKCASDAVYDSLFEELVTSRKVFDYMQGDKSQIAYTAFPDTRTIMFWI